MSVSAALARADKRREPRRLPPALLRLALASAAFALAALLLGGIGGIPMPGGAPLPRSPFGVGFREAAPAATGLGAWLLAVQGSLSASLQAAVAGTRTGDWGAPIGLGLAYGVFHAAGPGHGKAVIAGYIVAGERMLARGLALSLAAALLQACVAILIVVIGAWILNATAAGMNAAGMAIERASFALVAGLGAWLTWRKAGQLARGLRGTPAPACDASCGHTRLADADTLARLASWRARIGIVLAAGSRPCAGAVLVLVFALSQDLLAIGIATVLAMALGTALTTGALAALAVYAKRVALQLAGGRGRGGALALGALELGAAAFVLALGLTLLLGSARGVAA